MQRLGLALTFLLCSLTSMAQRSPKLLFIPRAVSQSLLIPGTAVTMDVPANFYLSKMFTGLQGANAIVELHDLPGSDYSSIEKESLQFVREGDVVVSKEVLPIDKWNATLLTIERDSIERRIILFFGDAKFSVIAVASLSSGDVNTEAEIRRSLMSIHYNDEQIADPLTSAMFRLDDSHSQFRFRKRTANTFYYSTRDTEAIREKDSYLTVTQLRWDSSTSPAVIGEMMLEQMSNYGLTNPVVKKRTHRKFKGDKAYESAILATRDGMPCNIYQMVVVHEDRAVIIHGIDTGVLKDASGNFRKLAHTLELR